LFRSEESPGELLPIAVLPTTSPRASFLSRRFLTKARALP
jgi:hypothetical protein